MYILRAHVRLDFLKLWPGAEELEALSHADAAAPASAMMLQKMGGTGLMWFHESKKRETSGFILRNGACCPCK